MMVMAHMQKAGHRPIALIGGGTAMVGDPTGRTDMRKMMTREEIKHNADCFKKQLSKFIEFGEGKAIMVDNADWLLDLNYIEFLRDIGVHFSVLERGLSFNGCIMQLGGDDQWSNILGGIDGMTFTLLTTSEGKKMGKTEKGALWLDANKTSPYEFYQYWRNIHDADVIKCLKLLTFVPMEEIEEYAKLKDQEINIAKKRLAFEVTKLIKCPKNCRGLV